MPRSPTALLLCLLLTASALGSGDAGRRPNVIFFVADDLNPSLSTYNHPVITPNFERLKSRSVQFNHAYVSVSVCAYVARERGEGEG